MCTTLTGGYSHLVKHECMQTVIKGEYTACYAPSATLPLSSPLFNFDYHREL